MMNNTVKWTLMSLNLLPYTHVTIRRSGENGLEYLGGGFGSNVIKRFGDEVVEKSMIIDNILCIYVK